MMRFVHFLAIERRHLMALAKSVLQAPPEERDSPQEMLSLINVGASQLYESDDATVLVRKNGSTLMLDALSCDFPVMGIADAAARYSGLAQDLQKLAAEQECDKIKTTVFDPRLSSVIQHLGGRVESWTLTLPVESSDG